MLTRIRNGIVARKQRVLVPASGIKERIAEILCEEGFLESMSRTQEQGAGPVLTLVLRYGADNQNAIQQIRRVSTPGQRRYVRGDQIPKVRSGLGIAILSTSKGVMTDRSARKQGVGGELLCEVW
jgi:small subunit ribosomal protein S8